jgi:hypothetical protein
MRLKINQIINREICHYSDSKLLITSKYNKIYIKKKNEHELTVKFPNDILWKRLLSYSRLARRLLRLDKCNIFPIDKGFIAIRQGRVFYYDDKNKELKQVLKLKNCRNIMHQSIAVNEKKEIFFGEYGNNKNREEVPVYKSSDFGKTWKVIFTFSAGQTKHVHGCFYDPFENKIWTATGDFENECHILCADDNFQNIEWIGDGQQLYRTCYLLFRKKTVHWIMDSQLQDSYHIILDRKTRSIRRAQKFKGPAWSIKQLEDNFYLTATVQEIGPGVKDHLVHFMVSNDLEKWDDIHQFYHDGLPKRFFKFGVVDFADGRQNRHGFYLFAEAIKGLDGKIALCEIVL